MTLLGLDPAYIVSALTTTYRDLERTCAMCPAWRRCARDLAKGDVQAGMGTYCLCAQTIDALSVDRATLPSDMTTEPWLPDRHPVPWPMYRRAERRAVRMRDMMQRLDVDPGKVRFTNDAGDVSVKVTAKHGGERVSAHAGSLADISGPVYHINHVGSLRISKAMYDDTPTDTPWGNLRWHSRHVVYNNPDGWGLADAPARETADGAMVLEFDWKALPPLIDLRRVVLPARRAAT